MSHITLKKSKSVSLWINPMMLLAGDEPLDFLPMHKVNVSVSVELREVTCDECGRKWHMVFIDDNAALGGTCHTFKNDKWVELCKDCVLNGIKNDNEAA